MIEIKQLKGQKKYQEVTKLMNKHIQKMSENIKEEEIWFLEHQNVFTAGSSTPKEFKIDKRMTKSSLINMLSNTIQESKKTITKLSMENLLKIREVQVYTLSGIGCLIHAVEHFSYHTGQIALLTKNITNNDLGFYDGIDLN